MNKSYLPLIIAMTLASISPAGAQQQDTGASGVIDGSDVYQFLNSGAIIDPTRMEEASRKFDSAIKMPDRVRQCKTWQEVIDRDRGLQNAGVGATYPGDGTQNSYAPANGTAPRYAGEGTGEARPGAPVASQGYATNNPAYSGANLGPHYHNPYAPNQPKPGFFGKLKNDFVRYSEWVGFPISDEPLPGDVDASLAGDLPAGPDPRVYVHETKHQPHQTTQVIPQQQAEREEQPPVVQIDNGGQTR